MAKSIALIGTFDTKGKEFLFVKELIESLGLNVFTIHSGVFEPQFTPDVSNDEVALAAGENMAKIAEQKDRAYATEVLAKGMEILLPNDLEVEMIRKAHELDILTTPYVFDEEQATKMAEAGADLLVAHMGLTTKGTIGAKTALTLDDCVERIQAIVDAGRAVNPDILVICHGGPIAEPQDAEYVINRVEGIVGFFGASSIERFAAEKGIKEQTKEFKKINK
ncbi:phosphoenolpyruvate hydrolase family protein [Lederbergia sp. NSJ-179]|uniref:phosphoenolpyruvate hydrolase family protein n=1 Tax=Lederbergia sp. NSJ-179 TaxID=2931402 RepID=UPI001FD0A226|nr:phosphoenolpyruvate hydrolase family protein [Lederbergia sp. NSJ-179]MCJ7843607.1 phosphoenolpyruvate hydrolase family protein [Lederbergia sp. NSJ-179]